jgi:CelD/BcsL family acetyltransferase involved in cellulose biosynthesis
VNKDWKFEWLTSWEEIWTSNFVTEWRNWMAVSPNAHVFFEPSIVKAWAITYDKLHTIQPRFLIARSDSGSITFIPLVYRKNNWKNAWLRVLQPVGYSEFDYHDPIVMSNSIVSDTNFWKVILEEVTTRWKGTLDIVIINGLHYNPRPAIEKLQPAALAPYINLTGFSSIDDFSRSLSRSFRGDIKRQKQRIETQGKLKLHVYGQNETEKALTTLPLIVEEHNKKWPLSYKAPGFYENLIRNCLQSGSLHMSEVLLDDQPISWHIGFIYKSRYYWYLPVYRSEYSQYSPGKLHLYMCIEEALRKNVIVFDLLKGDEDYKKQWTNKNAALFDLRYNSQNIISLIRTALLYNVKPIISKLVNAVKR